MNTLRTYVVEDSSIIRDNLTQTLHENAPIEVVGSAEDEAAAAAWLLDPGHSCDIVIVDIFLRSGSGIGLLKSLQARAPAMRRIVLSNHATPAVRAKCAELGADKVFDKSNEIDEMLAYFNRLTAAEAHPLYSMPSSR